MDAVHGELVAVQAPIRFLPGLALPRILALDRLLAELAQQVALDQPFQHRSERFVLEFLDERHGGTGLVELGAA
jgi:hypothetical protein